MSSFRLSTRYAKSILDLASEKKENAAVRNDMGLIDAALKNSHEFVLMLRSPIIPQDKKQKVLDKVFAGKISAITSAFIRLLVNKRRENYLPEIADAYITQDNKLNGITKVKITTAAAIDDSIRKQISTMLKEKAGIDKPEMESATDENLIGGFVVNFEDKQFDASIRRQMQLLSSQFGENMHVKKI